MWFQIYLLGLLLGCAYVANNVRHYTQEPKEVMVNALLIIFWPLVVPVTITIIFLGATLTYLGKY